MQPSSFSEGHRRLLVQMESIADLTDADRDAIGRLPLQIRQFPANQEIVSDGDQPSNCCLLIDGFMHRYKGLPDGTRQVLSYHLPGDIPDLLSLHLTTMDHALGTVATSRVAFIPHSAMRDIVRDFPNIAAAFWRETLIDSSVFREWIVNVGARPAAPRIAHLLCELFTRLTALGSAEVNGFSLPLTQVEIGEATGMSSVHVNRSLQQLRGSRLIASEGKFLRILDWPGLQEAGSFDPAYLHLKPRAAKAVNELAHVTSDPRVQASA